MVKCVFIGYPAGYKGWKFYNPETKKPIVSERADFDERHFPGLKKDASSSLPVDLTSHPPLPDPGLGNAPAAPVLGGNGHDAPDPAPAAPAP
ncbi:hypothetical protein BV25DRAFT_1776971, partial [Artomyces pyxidatus]